MTNTKVLITGGTGLLGTALRAKLEAEGYGVNILSRRADRDRNVFAWDYGKGSIDTAAFEGVETIFHLAGGGIADKRWSASRKKLLMESRTETAKLLIETIRKHDFPIRNVIAASGIGLYGFDRKELDLTETSEPGSDYIGEFVVDWEKETLKFLDVGARLNQVRIGIVLAKEGGALPKLMQPIGMYAGAPLASGRQFMSWIHIEDLVNMFIFLMQQYGESGVINATAPAPVTNREFTRMVAGEMNKPLFLPPVPSFTLHILLGEMAKLLTGGLHVSSLKIRDAGFQFRFNDCREALRDLINS